MTQYEVNGFGKFYEEDSFENGALPKTSQCFSDSNLRFSADSVEAIINKLMDFVGCTDKESVDLNACEKDGRIDIHVYEDANGYQPSESYKNQWRLGKAKLWFCIYTFHVEKVTREIIAL